MNIQRPRPVLTSAGIAGLITSLAGVLAFLGYNGASAHLSASTTSITAVIIGVVALGGHLLAGLHSQGAVTPVASAQDHDGMPLVRADTATMVPAPVSVLSPRPSPRHASTPAEPDDDLGANDLDPGSSDALAEADAIDPVTVPDPT